MREMKRIKLSKIQAVSALQADLTPSTKYICSGRANDLTNIMSDVPSTTT